MLLTEFDEELHDKVTFEAGKAEGIAEGKAEGIAAGKVEGKVEVLANLVVNGLLSLNDAVAQINLSKEEFIDEARSLNIIINR